MAFMKKKKKDQKRRHGNSCLHQPSNPSSKHTVTPAEEDVLFSVLFDTEPRCLLTSLLYYNQFQDTVDQLCSDLIPHPVAMRRLIHSFAIVECAHNKPDHEIFLTNSPASRIFSLWMKEGEQNYVFVRETLLPSLLPVLRDPFGYEMTTVSQRTTSPPHVVEFAKEPKRNTFSSDTKSLLSSPASRVPNVKRAGTSSELSGSITASSSSNNTAINRGPNRSPINRSHNRSPNTINRSPARSHHNKSPPIDPTKEDRDTGGASMWKREDKGAQARNKETQPRQKKGFIALRRRGDAATPAAATPAPAATPAGGAEGYGGQGGANPLARSSGWNSGNVLSNSTGASTTSGDTAAKEKPVGNRERSGGVSGGVGRGGEEGWARSASRGKRVNVVSPTPEEKTNDETFFQGTEAPNQVVPASPPTKPEDDNSSLTVNVNRRSRAFSDPSSLPPPPKDSSEQLSPSPSSSCYTSSPSTSSSSSSSPSSPSVVNLSASASFAASSFITSPNTSPSPSPPPSWKKDSWGRKRMTKGVILNEGKNTTSPSVPSSNVDNQERFWQAVTEFVNSITLPPSQTPPHVQTLLQEVTSALCKFGKPAKTSALSVIVSRFYFRYLCVSIVTPDTHRVVDNQLTPLQRRVLTLISKGVNSVLNGVRKEELESFSDLISTLSSKVAGSYPFLEEPQTNKEEQPTQHPKVSVLLTKYSKARVLADLRTQWPSLIAKVDSTFSSSTRNSLQLQISVLQGILFPSRCLLCPPAETVLFSAELGSESSSSLTLTDSFLYFYPYRSYSFHQAFRFKISSTSPAFILSAPRCVTLEFAMESVEDPKFVLEPYELDKTRPMELTFRSIDERDSFKNLLGLACGQSRFKEESGVMTRETEMTEDQQTKIQEKIARQEKEFAALFSQKDELINEFRNLSKETKALKIALAKRQ